METADSGVRDMYGANQGKGPRNGANMQGFQSKIWSLDVSVAET